MFISIFSMLLPSIYFNISHIHNIYLYLYVYTSLYRATRKTQKPNHMQIMCACNRSNYRFQFNVKYVFFFVVCSWPLILCIFNGAWWFAAKISPCPKLLARRGDDFCVIFLSLLKKRSIHKYLKILHCEIMHF